MKFTSSPFPQVLSAALLLPYTGLSIERSGGTQ